MRLKMSDKKYPVMLTKNEIKVINDAIDAYIASHVKKHCMMSDLYTIMRLNLELKYGITEIEEEESFDRLIDKGVLK